jgi:streptogramin lyase
MFAHWLRSVRRRLSMSAVPARRQPRRRPALETLEDRWAPSASSLLVTSYFDSAVYALNATNGQRLQTLVGPNSQSVLSGPSGITVGPDGNVYISSQNNNSIVEFNVGTGKLLQTPFISGVSAPAGLSFGPDGNLYVALGTGEVDRFDISNNGGTLTYTGTSTPIATGLSDPTEMAFGVSPSTMNTLYVSNSGAGTVVAIARADSTSPTTTTFIAQSETNSKTGKTVYSVDFPAGLTWHDGKLYVVDLGANTHKGQVLRFNANGSFNEVFAKPTSALTGQFPSQAVFNSAGDMLTANLGPTYPTSLGGPGTSGSISEFGPGGSFLGDFTRTSFPANHTTHVTNFSPSQMTLDAGDVAPSVSAGGPYAVNEGSSLTLHASASDRAGYALTYSWDINGDDTFGDATGANPNISWAQLVALGVDYNGTFTVRVTVSDGHGQVVTSAPVTLTMNYVAPTVNPLVAASYFDSAIYEFNPSTGALLNTLVAPYSQSILSGPAGLTVGPDGNLYISSQNNNTIVEYNVGTKTLSTFIDSTEMQATVSGGGAFAPAGLRFGPDGNLYVSSGGHGAVVRFDINNNGMLSYAGSDTTVAATTITAGLADPTEMTFGASAKDLNTLYVSNSGAGDVIAIAHADSATPTTTTFIAQSETNSKTGKPVYSIDFPSGLTWHGGKLYLVDLGATTHIGHVLRFNANGTFNEVFTHSSQSLAFKFPSDAVFNSAGDMLTADLGLNYPPHLAGSIDEFGAGGGLLRTLDGGSQFAETTPGNSGFSPSQLTLNLGSVAPKVSAGTQAYHIKKGHSLTLDAQVVNPEHAKLFFSWDINGDDTFGDAVGRNPTLSWNQLKALGINGPGTYQVSVMVSDGLGHIVTSSEVSLFVKP